MLSTAKRIVVKIGSALLVDPETGAPEAAWLASLADDIAAMRRSGQQVVIVSSGAVAIGRRRLGLRAPSRLDQKQAAAAVGQAGLMAAYQQAFEPHKIVVAQALLTADDTERRRRWLNARATLETLLELGAMPVVNENDTVATAEIRYGDNDRLAARAAQMMSADVLVLLSDIDGLYERDPRQAPGAAFIAEVTHINANIESMAGPAGALGSGGMRTKIEAARIATHAGCSVAITRGSVLHPLKTLADGGRATWFRSSGTARVAYKAWIAGSLAAHGAVAVDAGACTALHAGKSLLASGVKSVAGAFEKGDAVRILDPSGDEIGRGLARYDAADTERIRGLRGDAIAQQLGHSNNGPVIIHADDLVLT